MSLTDSKTATHDARTGLPPVDWCVSPERVPYEPALAFMEDRVTQIQAGTAGEMVWLLEHPPLYTAGTSSKPEDLLMPDRFPVYDAGRGGEYTYHGPGQRVAYIMLDLTRRGRDVRKFVSRMENWLIATAAQFGVEAGQREGRVGVWVDRGQGREDKIAAIGVRLRRWVSFHGISFNVAPDLDHFRGITPCGIDNPLYGVTSLEDLGKPVSMTDFDAALHLAFTDIFGAVRACEPPRFQDR